jgi:hypothetical protein
MVLWRMSTLDGAPAADVVADLHRLMEEFFRAVSFDSGERPPYEKLRGLFIDDGRLIKNSTDVPEISSVDQFIGPRQAMVDSGALAYFREVEDGEITEVFGNVAHRFSRYSKRGMLDGVPFETAGMISTQFIRTPSGWQISSMAWDDERPGLAIPDRYL